MNKIKSFAERVLGPATIGRLQYVLQPQTRDPFGGPFNGQTGRQRIFADLIQNLPLKAIVETGTFRGTTTAFLADSGLPVYSVEAHPRHHAYAKMRFRSRQDNIHLHLSDSRRFLRTLANGEVVPKADVLFYLDAHWNEDLPLRDEIDIVFSNWRDSVVMIDDFEVPGTDYQFDSYGPDKTLNLAHLEPLAHLGLTAFFPALEPEEETGAKRGCAILCREQSVADTLDRIGTLSRRQVA